MVTPFQETKDNLGHADETRSLVLIPPFTENIFIEEGPTQLKTRDIADAFVLGLASNATLGVNALGEDSIGALILRRVVNPNNTFHEHFRFSDFNDTTNTTGTFSTTNFNVNLTKGQIFQTKSSFLNIESPISAQISVTLTGGDSEFIVDNKGGKRVTITEGS